MRPKLSQTRFYGYKYILQILESYSYNIFFVRAVMVKSLYTFPQRNETKSIASTGCYPMDTIHSKRMPLLLMYHKNLMYMRIGL